MDDVFARIGLALQHLLHQSTVHGPEREEVARLAAELKEFEGKINAAIDERINAALDERIRAAVEAVEGVITAKIDQNLQNLAATLETAAIPFQPEPTAPPPPEPVVEPEPVEPVPPPTTGNIPAAPPEGADTVTAPSGDDSLESTDPDDTFNGADPDAFDHDGKEGPGGSEPNPPTDDPDMMTVAQLKEALDEKGVAYASDARKAELQDLLKAALSA